MGSAAMKEGLPLILAMVGSSAVGGLTAPQGQLLQSFSGSGGESPRSLLKEGHGLFDDYLSSVIDNAASPTTVKTTVQPLPSFAGGGLPFAIGAPAQDQNRLNPALRTSPGFSMSRRSLPASAGGQGGAVPPTPGEQANGVPNFWQIEDPNGNTIHDHDSALNALRLLGIT